jgi:hypothetical protein
MTALNPGLESRVYSDKRRAGAPRFLRDVIDASVPGRDAHGEARSRLAEHAAEVADSG